MSPPLQFQHHVVAELPVYSGNQHFHSVVLIFASINTPADQQTIRRAVLFIR
jgi:hypothetical protein